MKFGGLKKGLLRDAYQVDIEDKVTTLPKNATIKQRPIETINL